VKALEETMCDKELLVSYLYDDVRDAERTAFAAHLQQCAACRQELNALRGVRADLISWSPPQPDFGFRVIREPKVVAMPPRRWNAWLSPAAGLAAAAVLVLAAASSIAHVEVHRGPDGLTVRTGWSTAAVADARSVAAGAAAPLQNVSARSQSAPAPDPALFASVVRRLEALESASRDTSGVRNASVLSARASDAELLKRMRELLAQSETRQQGELALRIAQVLRDVDAQRVADLSRIQQGLRGIEASVSAEAAGHRELTNYILTSSKQK
jgi:hypothetical protein